MSVIATPDFVVRLPGTLPGALYLRSVAESGDPGLIPVVPGETFSIPHAALRKTTATAFNRVAIRRLLDFPLPAMR
jgi:hypothetical protein